MITRDIFKHLDTWLEQRDRRPLIVRGARQVGKSFAIRTWAEKTFGAENLLEINFEEQPSFKLLFVQDLDVERILDQINFATGYDLRVPGRVLFLDEIQAAPQALASLRFFYEKRPSLPVIAAGSLLEFALSEISVPVGRVEYLHMFPLSYSEFLGALGKNSLVSFIEQYDFAAPVPDLLHAQLLENLKLFFRIGGMPKAVSAYAATRDVGAASREHEIILTTYQEDFAKYAKRGQVESIDRVFQRITKFVGLTRVYYEKVDEHLAAGRVKRSIGLLEKARVVTRCECTLAKSLPLKFHVKDRLFKLFFVDVGLLQHSLGFDWRRLAVDAELPDLARGCLAEQFVAQELLQTRSQTDLYHLHYWDRPVQGADAEVDFIIEHDGAVAPLEVKRGLKGSLAGLHSYIREFQPMRAFVVSQRNSEQLNNISWIPLYLVAALARQA